MTIGRRPSSASSRTLPVLAAALLTALALQPAPVPSGAPGPAGVLIAGVEEEDIAGVLAGYRRTLEQGQKHLGELEFSEAIEQFSKLTDAYKTGRIPLVTAEAKTLVLKAYEGRALAFANLGRNNEASADFEALTRFDASYTIDLKGISPKIVALYTAVRKKVVGGVTVEVDPLGSEVFLNDQSLGLAPITNRDVVAGTYRLRAVHQGFDPKEEEIVIEPSSSVTRKVQLNPNARSILVATVPRDVKIIIDGKDRGATFGKAGAGYAAVASELGVSLSDISEPLMIEYLPPGSHEMVLRLPCYQEILVPLKIDVDSLDNSPIAYKPFVLQPSRGTLQIASEPSGAQVTLDGKVAGTTPANLTGVCAGRHDLLLEKAGMGRFAGVVEARRNETLKISQRLRLSLAVVDTRPKSDAESLGSALQSLSSYNVLAEGSGVTSEMADRVRLELETSQGHVLSEKTVRSLLESARAEMLAIASPAPGAGDDVDLQLYGPLGPVPDRWIVDPGQDGMRKVRFALESSIAIEGPWTGVQLVDVADRKHPVILAVTQGSPAATAGLAAGDVLVTAGAAPIDRSADFQAALRKAKIGEELPLGVEKDGKVRNVKLKILSTPVTIPMKDPGILYNKAIADLMQQSAVASEPIKKGYAYLNIGVALMHFRQWELALREGFRKADLPDAAGISKGTARYLSAMCYERLGMLKEAKAAYEEAAASTSATLQSHDGPLLSPNARRRSAVLSSSS